MLHPERSTQRRKRTAREVAEHIGCSPRTVRRWIAQTRTDYEAGSLMRLKPWETEGISRTTWYRRGNRRFKQVTRTA